MDESTSTEKMHVPIPVPYALLMFGATRRLSGVSFKEFSTNAQAAALSYISAYEKFGGNMLAWIDLSVEAADFGQKMVYPDNSTAHPDYSDPLIKEVADYRKLKKIDFKNAKRMQSVLEMFRILKGSDRFKGGTASGLCFGPLGVLSMMRSTELLFRDCLLHPNDVMTALETITQVLIEYVDAMCDAGTFGVCLDTLFASWNGVSRELWEKLEGPFVKELANTIRAKNQPVFIHNCGNGPYFDSQIRFMEPMIISFAYLPDDCKDRKELKKRYGDQVILMGCLETPLLSYGTPEIVMTECKKLIDDLAPNGNFILAPGCEFPPNAPFNNAEAIIEAAKTCN